MGWEKGRDSERASLVWWVSFAPSPAASCPAVCEDEQAKEDHNVRQEEDDVYWYRIHCELERLYEQEGLAAGNDLDVVPLLALVQAGRGRGRGENRGG